MRNYSDVIPYVYLDGLWLKRCWGEEVRNVSVLVAIAVNQDGMRELIGVAEGMKEDKSSWLDFLRWLKGRGLNGTRLFISDCERRRLRRISSFNALPMRRLYPCCQKMHFVAHRVFPKRWQTGLQKEHPGQILNSPPV